MGEQKYVTFRDAIGRYTFFPLEPGFYDCCGLVWWAINPITGERNL